MDPIDWKAFFKKVIKFVAALYSELSLFKIQLIMAAISIVLFLMSGQMLEIYRVLSEDFANRWPQAVMAVIGIGFIKIKGDATLNATRFRSR